MASDNVLVDRAILMDILQFIRRVGEHRATVEAVETSIDCGDFYNHVLGQLTQLVFDEPQPTAIAQVDGPRP